MPRPGHKTRQESGLQLNQPGSEYTEDELQFLRAIERYKREHRRPFPTWHEVLKVLLSLGYRKVPTEL